MINQPEIRTYKCKPMSAVLKDKVERSYTESLDLSERELRCPHCGRFIATLYSDTTGHFKAKCGNCKSVTVYNLGYFRRNRRYR